MNAPRSIVSLGLVLGLTLLFAAGCAAQQDLVSPDDTLDTEVAVPVEAATALAPLIVISIVTERLLEVMWDAYESGQQFLLALFGTKWVSPEGKRFWTVRTQADREKLAQEHVLNIKQITGDRETPEYKSYEKGKRLRAHFAGTVVALLFCLVTGYALFSALEMDVPTGHWVDSLLTSLMIGWGGTEFTHSIVDALSKGRKLWQQEKETSRQQEEEDKTQQIEKLVEIARQIRQDESIPPERREMIAQKLENRALDLDRI
jgi:uncharacterized membrane protein